MKHKVVSGCVVASVVDSMDMAVRNVEHITCVTPCGK